MLNDKISQEAFGIKRKKRRISLVYRKNRQWSALFLYKIV